MKRGKRRRALSNAYHPSRLLHKPLEGVVSGRTHSRAPPKVHLRRVELLYRIGLWLYRRGIGLAARRSPKARQWVDGRRGQVEHLRAWHRAGEGSVLWMHCASLGEFEQGRPVLEAWRAARPDWRILLTFFSPSGYEVRKAYRGADHVAYLPLDGPDRAAAFLEAAQPAAAIFVKYEFWYYYLTQMRDRQIPTLLIAAVFRSQQPFFKWYGSLHREMLGCFDQLFVQDKQSAEILAEYKLPVQVAGDTRIDRVLALAESAPARPRVADFCGDSPILIAGSTWPPDVALLAEWYADPRYADWKLIIAPHDVGFYTHPGTRRNPVPADLFNTDIQYYSNEKINTSARLLVIDNVGLLNSLYRYATAVYIGGGFGAGIHNTLEPMAFARPVLFGPEHTAFPEAVYLNGFPATGQVVNAADFKRKLDYLREDEGVYAQACERAVAYLEAHARATARIVAWMQAHLSEAS